MKAPSLPTPPFAGEEHLVAIPLVLPMGWTESAHYFCAVTEIIVDITNTFLKDAQIHPSYRLERHIQFNE
jgi:hypothetical protein